MTNLRKYRKAKGLTMKELGDLVGVTESAIGQYETEKRKPSYEVLLKLGEALECSVDELLREKENQPAIDDELVEALQILRDRPDLRALLHVGKNNSPESVKKLTDLMESMQEG